MDQLSQPEETGVQIDKEIARAVLVPAVSTMIADGEIHRTETVQLGNICGFSPIFSDVGPDDVKQLSQEIIEEIKKQGHQSVIQQAAETLSPALRETAYCFAVRIALADGILDEREKKAITLIVRAMDIPDETATKIFDVIAMMQRPATA